MGIRGMDHVAIPGLMKRVVSGLYINPLNSATGKRPELMRLIRDNLIEAYSWPIGPRQQGGKFTEKAKQDLVRLIDRWKGIPVLSDVAARGWIRPGDDG